MYTVCTCQKCIHPVCNCFKAWDPGTRGFQEKLSLQIRLLICFNSHQLASGSIHNKLFMLNSSIGKQMNIYILLAPIYVSCIFLPRYVPSHWPCVIYGQKFEKVENEENVNFVISLSKWFQM